MRKSLFTLLSTALIAISCTGTPQQTPTASPPQSRTVLPSQTMTVIVPTLTATATPTPLPTATNTPAIPGKDDLSYYPEQGFGPINFPEDINPLTGLKVVDPTILDRYPVAVKISIVPRGATRPPWGISQADIVYDYYHNNGYTRFHAIFYSQDVEYAGSVRSARLLDNILIRAYKSIFAYGSADPRINSVLFNSNYANRLALEGSSQVCPATESNPFCRLNTNGYEHLLVNTAFLTQYMAEQRNINPSRQFLDGNLFQVQPPTGGTPVRQIYTRYSADSYNRWDYDPESNKYIRFQDNVYDQGQGEEYAPLLDRLNNQQVTADNVVVLFVEHQYTYKTETSEIVDIKLNGVGKALIFRDGMAYEANWARLKDGDIISIIYEDGTRFPLHPGSTWFQVVGISTSSLTEGDIWRFQFSIP